MTPDGVPFFRLTLSLIAGIASGILLNSPLPAYPMLWCWLLIVLSSVFLVRKERLRPVAAGMMFLSHALLGLFLVRFHQESLREDHFSRFRSPGSYLQIKLESELSEKQNSWRCEATVYAVRDSLGMVHPANGRLLVYWPRKSNDQIPELGSGDLLLIPDVSVEIPGAAFPDGFDFRAAMQYRQIGYQVFLTKASFRKVGHQLHYIRSTANAIHQRILEVLSRQFNERHAALLGSLLLGYKDDVDPDDLKLFSDTGTMHILAVSGMHVGLIYMALILLFTGSVRSKKVKWWQGLIILGLLWAYAFITGFTASVVRAAIMFTVIEVGRSFLQREGGTLNSLFASAYIQLLFAPFDLLNVGFQLSYLAVLGIILFYPAMNQWWNPPTKVLGGLWQLGLVSVAATLGTLPATLYFFKSFPLWFIPANMLIVPLSSALIFSGILSLIVFPVPWLGAAVVWLTAHGLDLMLWAAAGLARLPMARMDGFYLDLGDTFLLSVMVILLAVMVHARARKRILLMFAATALVFSGKQMVDIVRADHTTEFIGCEIRGDLLGVLRNGRELHVFSEPMSKGRADTLAGFMADYRVRHHIRGVYWHFSGQAGRAGPFSWGQDPAFLKIREHDNPMVTLVWMPEALVPSSAEGRVFGKFKHRRIWGENSRVELLRNSYKTIGTNDY